MKFAIAIRIIAFRVIENDMVNPMNIGSRQFEDEFMGRLPFSLRYGQYGNVLEKSGFAIRGPWGLRRKFWKRKHSVVIGRSLDPDFRVVESHTGMAWLYPGTAQVPAAAGR
ncbi:hypothetical protein ES703_90022 [subsurface metagenome]